MSPDMHNCLQVEKSPHDYNEEDLKIIKDYEERVAFYLSERERYRKMLETEFQKLSQTLKVRKFSYLLTTGCPACYCWIIHNV
jgi:plasmid stabilization system protein ParE